MRVIAQVRAHKFTGRQAIFASLAGAALTAVCANIAFYLPGNPVPVTGQVFAVILCGMVLGGRLGALSQIEYIAAGLMGAPIFTGFRAGSLVLAGPTVGYLVGFVAAAYMVGRLMEVRETPTFHYACLAGILGVAAIHMLGVAWISIWGGGTFQGFAAWVVGAVPFIGVDVAKVVLAAGLCARRP
ncbi:MAG: biotin transporter BioY [Armatimonadota bacterium]|nr:biotin transporter BioY [bacterium]